MLPTIPAALAAERQRDLLSRADSRRLLRSLRRTRPSSQAPARLPAPAAPAASAPAPPARPVAASRELVSASTAGGSRASLRR